MEWEVTGREVEEGKVEMGVVRRKVEEEGKGEKVKRGVVKWKRSGRKEVGK